jgi:hypothetical protein
MGRRTIAKISINADASYANNVLVDECFRRGEVGMTQVAVCADRRGAVADAYESRRLHEIDH